MKPQTSLAFGLILTVLALTSLVGLGRQWKNGLTWRSELELAQLEVEEFTALRAENTRLQESRISTAELDRLRADHDALPRLRAELDALTKRKDDAP